MSREKNEKSQMKSYGILLVDEEQRPVSNCCDALPKGNVDIGVKDSIGICSDCGEWADFPTNHED
jgi:hypothetical protein